MANLQFYFNLNPLHNKRQCLHIDIKAEQTIKKVIPHKNTHIVYGKTIV